MINRKNFYDKVRISLFKGSISQLQLDGMSAILDEWEFRKLTDLRWLAYMLGTTYHETAFTMQPIEEYGKGRGRTYGSPDPITKKVYYGRGFVQLTWKDNYRKMSPVTGEDLVQFPEKALKLNNATKIMFEGMLKGETNIGDFTGKSLEQYFNATTEDWINARRIINGLDKAEKIAKESKLFYEALK